MVLYNIHTHQPSEIHVEGYEVKSILNLYPADFEKASSLRDANTYFSVGVHPWYLEDADRQIETLKAIAHDKSVVAIGEAGLDKLKGEPLRIQERIFRMQIELSIQLQKPLIIHCVKAWDELISLYREYKPSNTWIIHGYRGNGQQAKQLENIGFKFSLGEQFNEEIILSISPDSIFCETDTSNGSVYTIYYRISSLLEIKIGDLSSLVGFNVNKAFIL